jgi:hypothetical protein
MPISQKLRIEILKRDSHKCLWCGRGPMDDVSLDVDHVLSEFFSGSTTNENLGTLCNHCNRSKGIEYFGQYLLTTIFKVRDIWSRVEEIDLKTHIGPEDNKLYDGFWFMLSISFFRDDGTGYREITRKEFYCISSVYLTARGPDPEIRISEIKRKALLNLKDKLRDYLFDNRGFIEQLDDKLIFRERKLDSMH